MTTRQIITSILLLLGVLLAFLPLSGKYSLHANPGKVLAAVLDESNSFTPDQVARFVVTEDSTLQLIDLRTPGEFRVCNIPGSVNIPYAEFLKKDPGPYLDDPNMHHIFYSNDDMNASYAQTLAIGLEYKNCFVMKGGLNAWYADVMNSEFKGDKISARENALFETRFKARNLFNEVNGMPDSLKIAYIASKRFDPKKLDGGCE
jgi:sulfur-carrier protein adenylyltransferase/sulfurtransferase